MEKKKASSAHLFLSCSFTHTHTHSFAWLGTSLSKRAKKKGQKCQGSPPDGRGTKVKAYVEKSHCLVSCALGS